MFDELLEIVKEFFKKLFSSRLFALSVIFTVMFAGLLGKLFQMQILDGSEYQETYMQRTEKNVTTPGSRGNIYDRNGNRLAYNELAYSVTIQDLGDYPRPSSRNQMLYRLVRILDRRGETVEGKFEIALDQNGEMFFTSSSDSARTRFFLNFYGLSSTASLNDRNKPSLEVVMKVHQTYNYVNLEWLLYGRGEMLASAEESSLASSNSDYQPSLFDENPVNPSKETITLENRKEMALRSTGNTPKEIVKQEIRYIEKPARKITEIRIFFDDNTYETFRPEK